MRVLLNAASVCFVFEQLCGEAFLRASKLALFFLFTNDGIFLHLYIYFICIDFVSVCHTLLPHLKEPYFHTFLHFTFIYQFPRALDCTLRCIFL